MLAQSAVPVHLATSAPAAKSAGWGGDDDDLDADGMPSTGVAGNAVVALANDTSDLRKTLIGLAMQLRDIRYVRGGRDPSTGFDCSGFVRYVFAHAVGLELPTNSASQFLAGLKVSRDDMKPGDLVFFRTAGKRGQGRISHVGIYIANGQFIHSPSRGKTVRVDSLDESYWAQRFAGAKRPGGLARS
jgi:cell wall-associated NlpC family hydrolase